MCRGFAPAFELAGYGTLITCLAFVDEFIPDWPVMTDTKEDNMTGKFTNFSVLFTPYLAIVSGYSDLLLFTTGLSRKWTREGHIIAHDFVLVFTQKF